MATQAKQLTAAKSKTDWNQFAKFTLTKLTENVYDMVITIVVLALLLSYLLLTQPEAAVAYGGYIIVLYVLILVRRVVQDFDEHYTLDEIGKQNEIITEYLRDLHRMQRAETNVNDDILEQRLHALD